MSWSINLPPNIAAPQAIKSIRDYEALPDSIKSYIMSGIAGLQALYKNDGILVTVSGYGHVCDGENYEVTSAVVEVRPGEVTETTG